MPNERERYLDALCHLVKAEGIAPEACEAMRHEVAGHLDESITSRLELGGTPEDAERHAVVAFGPVREFAREMIEAYDPAPKGVHRPTLLAAGGVLGLSCLAWLMPGHVGLGVAVAMAYVGLGIAGYRGRRLQWRTFGVLFLPFWLGITTTYSLRQATVPVPVEVSMGKVGEFVEGSWPMDRKHLPVHVARQRERVLASETAVREMDVMHATYRRQDGWALPRSQDPAGALTIRQASSALEADGFWRRYEHDRTHLEEALRWNRDALQSAEAAVGRPWWREFRYQMSFQLIQSFFTLALCFLLHAFGVALHMIHVALRRSLPPQRLRD